MSNGVMPCVLGPTSFNLKFWANILISDEHQNVVVFMMIFIWVHHVLHLGSSLPTLRRVYLLLKMTDLLCFCFLLFTYYTVHKAWKWRRRLWAWEEEELEECRALLTDVSLQDFVSDRWVWLPDPLVGYSVLGSYHMLTSRDVPLRDPASSLIWLLRDRLPTKANLVQRRVLDSEASLCVSDCGMSETAQRLFLSCDAFSSLWPLMRNWLGILGVDTNVLLDHFLQFVNLTGGGKVVRDFLQLIWLLCV
ncbi:transmembrane protein, putative [Medicago truncatula]|uniref:Transmembrane protein, putative n=1 Tax=Medicago truncatula TaxID=3880 RepID=G7JG00_MEDTR|nr:transmembrane protein, putative [Medicago truncatula]